MMRHTLSIINYSLANLCRLVVSATFVFSGLVKIIDPHGTVYKIQDYLAALHLQELFDFPLLPWVITFVIAVLEFCLGVCLFFNIRRRMTILFMLFITLLYTPLTLWLAITDAVTDCGCFGDALHLTNWQTFGKNLVLVVLLIYLWQQRNRIISFLSESLHWIVSLFTILYAVFLLGLTLYGEPIIDFRPFHIGQHIPTAMEMPEDPLEQPEIIDFSIEPIFYDTLAYYQIPGTEELLADTSYTFLLTAPNLEDADDSNMERINAIYDYAKVNNYRFICLTASADSTINRWQDLTGAEYPFAFMDELTLKTITRSNPGLVLLHNGTIVGKWSHRTMPSEKTLIAPLHELSLAHPRIEAFHTKLILMALWYLGPLAALILLDRLYISIQWWRRKRKQNTTAHA